MNFLTNQYYIFIEMYLKLPIIFFHFNLIMAIFYYLFDKKVNFLLKFLALNRDSFNF